MTIPKGATHVDKQGDYYKSHKLGSFTIWHDYCEKWGSPGFYGQHDAELLGIKPITKNKTEYPGQFEPWKYCEAHRDCDDVSHSAAMHADVAIKEMMRC